MNIKFVCLAGFDVYVEVHSQKSWQTAFFWSDNFSSNR